MCQRWAPPARCQRVANEVPTSCQRAANELPTECQSGAKVVPTRCQRGANVRHFRPGANEVSASCQRGANELPTRCQLVPTSAGFQKPAPEMLRSKFKGQVCTVLVSSPLGAAPVPSPRGGRANSCQPFGWSCHFVPTSWGVVPTKNKQKK